MFTQKATLSIHPNTLHWILPYRCCTNRIGSNPDGEQRFTGLLQDLRLYSSWLNRSEIHELLNQPTKINLHNVSGYLTYGQEEKLKLFLVEVQDDQEEEGKEVFYLQLVAVQGGARLPMPRPTAILRIMKSDNANGLFAFTGSCIPDVGAKQIIFFVLLYYKNLGNTL